MLRLGGAYRLTDAGLGPLLRRAPALEALALPQCSRLDCAFLAALPAGLRCGAPQVVVLPAVRVAGSAPIFSRQRLM